MLITFKASDPSIHVNFHMFYPIQVCVIGVAGGFASYLLGLNTKTYELTGVGTEGNNPNTVRDPGFGWMTAFLFVVCFVGLFILIPLRKVPSS